MSLVSLPSASGKPLVGNRGVLPLFQHDGFPCLATIGHITLGWCFGLVLWISAYFGFLLGKWGLPPLTTPPNHRFGSDHQSPNWVCLMMGPGNGFPFGFLLKQPPQGYTLKTRQRETGDNRKHRVLATKFGPFQSIASSHEDGTVATASAPRAARWAKGRKEFALSPNAWLPFAESGCSLGLKENRFHHWTWLHSCLKDLSKSKQAMRGLLQNPFIAPSLVTTGTCMEATLSCRITLLTWQKLM